MLALRHRVLSATLAGLAALACAVLGTGHALATGPGDCGSVGHAVPDGGGWKLECPGSCEGPPAGQVCKQGAWFALGGWDTAQFSRYLADGVTFVGVSSGDDPRADRLQRRNVEGVTQWRLKCVKVDCTGTCDDVQTSDPTKWDCYCE